MKLLRNSLLPLMLAGLAQACPEQVPDGFKATPVAEEAAVNGMVLEMLQVQGKGQAGVVLDALERKWNGEGYEVKRSSAEGWQILAALSDRCLTTMQLVDRDGAFGYFAVNRLRKPSQVRAAKVPMPRGAVVSSTVTSTDQGRQGMTMTASASGTVAEVQAFFQQRLRAEGWGAMRAMHTMDKSGQVAGVLVTAQRDRQHIDVTLVRRQGTEIVVNVAELP